MSKSLESLKKLLAMDREGWNTISGAKVLIGKEGQVEAGLGGKFTGKNISQVKGSGKQNAPKEAPKQDKTKKEAKKEVQSAGQPAVSGEEAHAAFAPPELTGADKQILTYYTGGGFTDVNNTLRTGKDLDATNTRVTQTLDSLMQTTDKDVSVYRGMSEKFGQELKVGSSFVDNGYTSTSSDINVSKEFAAGGPLMEVRVPKGSKALSVRDNAIARDEQEIVLARGGKYVVTGIRKENGQSIYEVEVQQ